MNQHPIIQLDDIHKTYGNTKAVDGISFDVQTGEIFGIVGPNGAGKTTTVESMIGLRQPDKGAITLLGLDPHRQRATLAQRIGIQLQEANLPERLKVWEILDLFSSFYDKTVPYEPLLEQWGLTEKRTTYFRNLSGGQKQRLFIALALLNDPEIVFLDELTTGLDPQARRNTWELVAAIREQGKTVILVTHFMDEAEVLCDRVAVIDRGKLIALDTPSQLVHNLNNETQVLFHIEGHFDMESFEALSAVSSVSREGNLITITGGDRVLSAVVIELETQQTRFTNLRTAQPNLEDAFIALTGRKVST